MGQKKSSAHDRDVNIGWLTSKINGQSRNNLCLQVLRGFSSRQPCLPTQFNEKAPSSGICQISTTTFFILRTLFSSIYLYPRGVLGISSDGDDPRIFLGTKIWQVFFWVA